MKIFNFYLFVVFAVLAGGLQFSYCDKTEKSSCNSTSTKVRKFIPDSVIWEKSKYDADCDYSEETSKSDNQ